MIWWFLAFSQLCFAAVKVTTAPSVYGGKFINPQAKEIWSVEYLGEKPTAAFFDAASGSIYVSVDERNGRARLDRVSLAGVVEKRGMATFQGAAGPLRAYDGKIYWAAGSSVQIVDPKGARTSMPATPGLTRVSAIAVDRHGVVYLLENELVVYRVGSLEASMYIEGGKLSGSKKFRGLFLYLDRLYLALDNRLLSFAPAKDGEQMQPKDEGAFCDCRFLERTSAGKWLTTAGGRVLVDGKSILTLKTGELGHPAYVFRMDTAEDFFVLPLPSEGKLVAYRMPAMEKAKKSDK